MKTISRNMVSRLFTLLAALALALAQGTAQAEREYSYSQQQLDQTLAPIALYPDALLTQILIAATYPMQVVEAARWSRDRPDLSGDDAVRAVESENWDPSVKSLLAFPQVLARMAENLQWTQTLGDAFLWQQAQVMDTVQALRHRARAAGNLRSDEHLRVAENGPSLLVQPVNPRIIYVPYYNPLVVYGSWWWPAHPPVHWQPWPSYYARPGYASGFYFGPSIRISAEFFFGAIDWPRRQVGVVQMNKHYFNNATAIRQVRASPPDAWNHNPDRRAGVAYHGINAPRQVSATNAPMALPDRDSRKLATDGRRFDGGANAHPNARLEQRAGAAQPEVRAALPQAILSQTSLPRAQLSAVREKAGVPVVAKHEPVVNREPPRPSLPSTQVRLAQVAARPQTPIMAVAQHQALARHEVPQTRAAHAETRPPQAAARQETRVNGAARLKKIQ